MAESRVRARAWKDTIPVQCAGGGVAASDVFPSDGDAGTRGLAGTIPVHDAEGAIASQLPDILAGGDTGAVVQVSEDVFPVRLQCARRIGGVAAIDTIEPRGRAELAWELQRARLVDIPGEGI